MTTITKGKIKIEMDQSEPVEYLEWLIKAIASAIRWRACMDDSDTVRDDRSGLIVLSELLSELATVSRGG